MTIGLKINQDGSVLYFNYTQEDFVNRFNRFVNNRGVGQIECFHTLEKENEVYLFYGWTIGYNNYNMYEFHNNTVYGDAFIVSINSDMEVKDVDMDTIEEDCFPTEDLDDTLLEDELELEETDEYDYTSGFLVRDSDIEDSD